MSTIRLYRNASERNTIGKALTPVGNSFSCVIKGDTTILNPTFIFHSESGYPVNVNYIYWQEVNRYYYIDNMQVMSGGRIALICSVDVLETYKTQIKQQTAIISKQQNTSDSNLFYNDGSYVTDTRDFYTIKSFPNGFNDNGEFILVTAGA